MAVPNHLTETDNATHISGAPVDPFAVDFFGGAKLAAEDDEAFVENDARIRRRPVSRKKSDWYKNLPRIANREAEFSNQLANLPENLTGVVAAVISDTLARYALQRAENVECALISVREVNLNHAIRNLNEAARIFLTVGGRTENSRAIAALETDFAARFVGSILDGQGKTPGVRRELSPIETAIVEFLAANALNEINVFLGSNMLSLENVSERADDLYETYERGAELTFELRSSAFEGIVVLFAPAGFLRFLDQSRNPFFTRKNERKKLSDFEKIVPAIDLRLQIGTTFLDADSLSFLEPDDIVLIEQPQIGLHGENFAGNMQILLGRGANFRLRGAADFGEPNEGLNFRIEEITSEETRRRFTPAKFKMDEKENDLTPEGAFEANADQAGVEEIADEQISPSLENVQVGLRVEIAGNKMSLRELQNLRAGQIIALGTSPNDPVRLIADNNDEAIATGELIEIEGQLGVRLTKVFI